MFQALLDTGVESSYAVELVGDTRSVIYRQWGEIPKFVSRPGRRDPSASDAYERGHVF